MPHPVGFPPDVEPSCAICGAPPYPGCPHESERLQMALNQALDRWNGVNSIQDWVLSNARNQVNSTFEQMKAARYQAHNAYLLTLPCYTLYLTYNGHPPLLPQQLNQLHYQINNAYVILKQGVDEDWRRSCLKYPEILDYYFSLIDITFPEERDVRMKEPRFGGGKEPKKVKERRDSLDLGSEKGKKGRRRDGRTPEAPMPGNYRR